uniref:CSON004526 protein n=1 Tax=Culicoides sonorensis TaxID=179676 RepID=A0A336L430_CULSO
MSKRKLEDEKLLSTPLDEYRNLIKTGLDLDKEPEPKLSFQVKSIDTLLNGGLSLKGITEISGESGCGKTQLCMFLCLTVQFPMKLGGLGKKSIYITTEDDLRTERVIVMAKSLIKKHKLEVKVTDFLDNLIYIKVLDEDLLLQLLEGRLQRLLEMEPIGLIVIDSITAIFRLDSNYIDRADRMRELVMCLQNLSQKYGFLIVCVNQVSNNLVSEVPAPALGLAWANLITTRLQIIKKDSASLDKKGNVIQKRVLKVIWAPKLPPSEATFYIKSDGIS